MGRNADKNADGNIRGNPEEDILISVVVPVYNVERYLRRCVMSIICQDHRELEIILVDDGSTDECPRICDEFAAKDKRIRVIHKANGGLSSARNAGIAMAAGQYIMLVDADDYVDARMAGVLLKLIQKDGTDLALCSFMYVDDSGKKTREDLMAYCPLKNGILYRDELLGRIHADFPGYWFYSVPWNKLYKSEILKKLQYPESRVYEDEFMIHHLFGSVESVSVTKESFYMYTQRTGSISQTNGYDSLKKMDFVFALEDRYKYFKENGYRTYAADTADLLYNEYARIVKNAFRSRKDCFRHMGEAVKISGILLREKNIKGVKLPLVYIMRTIAGNKKTLSRAG